MKPKRLLRELESLAYDARVRRMIELGRLAKNDAEIAATITLFERGGFDERGLALSSCYNVVRYRSCSQPLPHLLRRQVAAA